MANIFDELAGLPAHPLAVHAPVILIPLAALTALLYTFLPRARSSLRWWLGGFAAVGTATAWFATQTGEHLKAKLGTNPDIEHHEDLGNLTWWWSLTMLGFVAALIAADSFHSRRGSFSRAGMTIPWRTISLVLTVGMIGAAGVTVTYLALTGHAGAELVWDN